jgi:hypothetical protein
LMTPEERGYSMGRNYAQEVLIRAIMDEDE